MHLSTWTSFSESVAEFRFCKRDVQALAEALLIPETITALKALCMLLKRMSYPCRYGGMIHRFAKLVPVLSMITNQMLDYIYNTNGHKVTH